MRSIIIALIALLTLSTVGGCSSAQLTSQAEKHEDAASIAVDTADRIQAVLDRYPAGSIEDGQLAQFLAGVMPDEWKGRFEALIAVGNSVRESAEILASQLPAWAEGELARAETLRLKADAQDSKFNNFVSSITSVTGSAGGLVALIGALAGVWFKRGQNKAKSITADIVTSIEAAKAASPELEAAFSNAGGAAMRSSMTPETMRIIKAIRDSH